jgi:hypothetical protein
MNPLTIFLLATSLLVLNAKRRGGNRDRGFESNRPGGIIQFDNNDADEDIGKR